MDVLLGEKRKHPCLMNFFDVFIALILYAGFLHVSETDENRWRDVLVDQGLVGGKLFVVLTLGRSQL